MSKKHITSVSARIFGPGTGTFMYDTIHSDRWGGGNDFPIQLRLFPRKNLYPYMAGRKKQ